MKKILIVYQSMVVGGSTTSLLSFLNSIDKSRYEVDLLLSKNNGELFSKIPEDVNLLEAGRYDYPKYKKLLISAFHREFYKKILKKLSNKRKRLAQMQLNAYNSVYFSRRLEKEYDAAIGFIEFWSDAYVLSDCVKAKKRIIWIHTDYSSAGFDPAIDREYFKKADNIVHVSQKCLESFNKILPEFRDKSIVVENIFSKEFLTERANEYLTGIEKDCPIFLTVCRVDIVTKGLDRLVNVVTKLKDSGYKFKWYIVGGGECETLKRMCSEHSLDEYIFVVGNKDNPYPYYKAADCFVLTSRYEGKPMVITEAQMLGLPCIVAKYTSSGEQINSGIDGVILENSEEGIFDGIKELLDNPEKLNILKENIRNKEFKYDHIISRINNELFL